MISDTALTFFPKVTSQKGETITLSELIQWIRAGEYKEAIENIRATPAGKERDRLKKQLPAVTVSGLFDGQRKADLITARTGLLCLDFDKVDHLHEKLIALKRDPYSIAVFMSPSGNGIKVIVAIDPQKHLESFKSIAHYFKSTYQLTPDSSCKDVSRLMYVSYDPDLFYNEDAKKWSQAECNAQRVLAIATDLGMSYPLANGTRNAYCFKLAIACKKQRLTEEDVIAAFENLYQEPDFDSTEIRSTVRNAYSKTTEVPETANKGFTRIHAVEAFINERYELRFNEVSHALELRNAEETGPFTVLNENNLFIELMKHKLDIGQAKLQTLLRSAFVPTYDPFRHYFESLAEWQPETDPDYIEQLCRFIEVKDQPRFNRHIRKMLIRTIACALEAGVFNKQCLVLVQKKQNSGKSTFCRWLCPPALADHIAENINTDKDSLIALSTNFLINLDELATLSRTEINSLKSFMSKDKINARLPYDRKASVLPRRASFIGSTNQLEFLVDDTGSVRWLCFEVIKIDFNYKTELEINDVWRQAYHLYRNGEPYQLSKDEVEENDRSNRAFQVQTPEMEWLIKYYIPCSKEEGGTFMTTTEMVKAIEDGDGVKLKTVMFGKALSFLEFEKVSNRSEEARHSIYGYYVKKIRK